MRLKKVKFNDGDALMIYLTQKENEDEIIKKTIEDYKEQFKDIAIFVSGTKNIEDVLTNIIKDKM